MRKLNIKITKDKKTVNELETGWNKWFNHHRKCNAPYVFELDDGYEVEILIG